MQADLSAIPEVGFLREKQIVGDLKATPPIRPIVPISRSHWWQLVRDGRAPAPVKLSQRVTAWRSSDIRNFVASFGTEKERALG